MTVDLDNIGIVSKIDSSNMIDAIARFPDPFLRGQGRMDRDLKINGSALRSLVLIGMGGSASAADVTLDWLRNELKIPAFVHRQPGLPAFVNSHTLVVGISYSGQTLETVSAFREAHSRNCQLVGIGTGGKLSNLCHQFNAPFITIESTIAPRAGLSQMIVASATVISKLGLVRPTRLEMLQAGKDLVQLGRGIRKETPLTRNPAKRFASKLSGHFVTVYALDRMASVARRFKNQLAENSKLAARYGILPEACHNEIEAWKGTSQQLPVIVRDRGESRLERLLVQSFKETVRSATGSTPMEVRSPGKRRLSRLLSAIFFLDYVSVYLAILRKVDPTPTANLEQFKRKIAF